MDIVYQPSSNTITGGYSDTHRGYDFSGKGDLNCYAPFDGVVEFVKEDEKRNWQVNATNDPYRVPGKKRSLLTADYGNYIKIKGSKMVCILAHLEYNSVVPSGTKVKAGDIIAKIGNTGNSTGRHLHSEFRTLKNENIQVSFSKDLPEQNMDEFNRIKKFIEEKKPGIQIGQYEGTVRAWFGAHETVADLQRQAGEANSKVEIANRAKQELSKIFTNGDPNQDWEALIKGANEIIREADDARKEAGTGYKVWQAVENHFGKKFIYPTDESVIIEELKQPVAAPEGKVLISQDEYDRLSAKKNSDKLTSGEMFQIIGTRFLEWIKDKLPF